MTLNIPSDSEFENLLAGVLALLFTTATYVGTRLLKICISPKLCWLFCYAKSPDSYSVDKPAKHVGNSGGPHLRLETDAKNTHVAG